MECPQCHKPNPDDKKYCGDCGSPLITNFTSPTEVEKFVGGLIESKLSARFATQFDDRWFTEKITTIILQQMQFDSLATKAIEARAFDGIIKRLTDWGKWIALLFGASTGGFALLGWLSWSDVSKEAQKAKSDIDSTVKQTTQGVKQAGDQFDKLFNDRNKRGEQILARIQMLEKERLYDKTRRDKARNEMEGKGATHK